MVSKVLLYSSACKDGRTSAVKQQVLFRGSYFEITAIFLHVSYDILHKDYSIASGPN